MPKTAVNIADVFNNNKNYTHAVMTVNSAGNIKMSCLDGYYIIYPRSDRPDPPHNTGVRVSFDTNGDAQLVSTSVNMGDSQWYGTSNYITAACYPDKP